MDAERVLIPAEGERKREQSKTWWDTLLPVCALSLALLTIFAYRPAVERLPATPRSAPVARVSLSAVQPLIGQPRYHVVHPGETLLQIARSCNMDTVTLAHLNNLEGKSLQPGQRLLLPSMTILPARVADGIVLNIPERGIYIFRRGRLLDRFPCAVGKRGWETPIGRFKIVRMVVDPIWIPPTIMVKREHTPTHWVDAGPGNPIGDRWMGWSAPEVGFHSTYETQTVGHAASHACVRLYIESAHTMFHQVYIGMPIYSLYEPAKIGQKDGDYYLSVSPDVYEKGVLSPAQVRRRLEQAGLLSYVDMQKVRRIVARQDGYPYLIYSAKSPQAALR